MMRGVDYSWARPGGAAIREAGFEFAMRYVPYPGDGGKGLTVDEITDLRANGIAIGLVFESTAGRMLEGVEAGQSDANVVLQSLAALGVPASVAVYFACDTDVQPFQFDSIDAYLGGAASVLGAGRVGVYGEYDVVEHCQAAETAAWFWQTYAWSGGQVFAGNHVHQYLNGQTLDGGAVDYNTAADEFGQWKTEEDDMTPEQREAEFFALMSKHFPGYIEAYYRGEFTVRNAELNEGEASDPGPIRPWLADIDAARCHHAFAPDVTGGS